MSNIEENLKKLNADLLKAKDFFFKTLDERESSVHIYTHIDADGISSGAILGKALYRENIPFQISVLRQLEREEIIKIAEKLEDYNKFLIFSDFGSGQYIELQKYLTVDNELAPFLILDHHLLENISNKEELELIDNIHKDSTPWHINSYFYHIDGSTEISGAGMSYFFAKCLNNQNLDLSQIAIIGAIGDIQNQGPNKTFLGLNTKILEDAKNNNLIEVVDDLNFSTIKPLNEALAYSSEIKLPGLTNDVNKTLKFLQTLGIFMENPDGSIKNLSDLNKDEKQKISSGIIEYATLKLDIEPNEIINKLIVKRYLLKNEISYSELYDSNEFSNILNACGRTNNASLGIAIAMGDRKKNYQNALENLVFYKKSLLKSFNWLKEENKIHSKEFIQYFFGENIIPENIIGTIASMLIFDNSNLIDKKKPIFGIANREDEAVYKISGRAHEIIVNKGINLSEAIRETLKILGLENLGGGHPPAAGTKIPLNKIEEFLDTCNKIIKNQLNRTEDNQKNF